MTTPNEAKEAILARWVSLYASFTIYTFANESFDPPNSDTAWVRVTIIPTFAEQSSLGKVANRRFTRQAILAVQSFVPLNTGTQLEDAIAKKVEDNFEGVKIVSPVLWLMTSTRSDLGVDNQWKAGLVEIPYSFQEVK